MKLSPAQLRLLKSLATGPQSAPEGYAPAEILVARGLAVRQGSTWAWNGLELAITDGGRNLLWTPLPGETALFVKSGNLVRVIELHSDGNYTVERTDTGKAMLVTRAGLMPAPPAAVA